MDDTSAAASDRENDDTADEQEEGVVDEQLEEHDLPPLPDARPADGPAPAA